MTDAIRELFELLAKKEKSGSDYTGTITRVEGKTAYVRFNGSDIDDTPVALSIGASPGDAVRVRVADGRAWITGNDTCPPNDSSDVAYDLIQTNAYIRQITTEKIRGENGWIDLLTGTFDYGNGSLSWNGDHLTVKGTITASSGQIGPWTVGSTAIYKGSATWGSSTTGAAYFGNNGISITDKFMVDSTGALTATGATISGTLTAGANSKIGPWTVTATSIYKTNSAWGNATAGAAYFGNDGISITDKFKVTAAGAITATSGTLGSWTLTTASISATANNANTGNVNRTTGLQWPGSGVWSIVVGATSAGDWSTGPFRVNHKGDMYASSGKIGPWTINTSGLTNTNGNISTQIYTSYIYLKNGSYENNLSADTITFSSSAGMSNMKATSAEFKSTSGEAIVRVQCQATNGRNGYLIANATSFGLFDSGANAWVLRSGNDGYTYLLGKLYCIGTEDNTGRPPIQSITAATGLVSFMSANTSALAVRGRWGASSGFTAKNFTPASSDIRIKTDINKSNVHALELIRQINICEFKKQGVYQPVGMVADWLQELDPLLAVGGGYEEDGAMNIKSVDTFYLMGYVVKAIQELADKVNRAGG